MSSPADLTRFVADFIGESNFIEGSIASYREGLASVGIPGVGLLWARRGQAVSEGTAVVLAVRPERITLEGVQQPAPPASENCLLGRLTEATYAGATLQYTVLLANGATLLVRAPNLGLPSPVGDEVRLRWSPTDCSVLQD